METAIVMKTALKERDQVRGRNLVFRAASIPPPFRSSEHVYHILRGTGLFRNIQFMFLFLEVCEVNARYRGHAILFVS
jgi:hypothetical protein